MTAPPLKKSPANCIKKRRYSDEFAARAAGQSLLQQKGQKDGVGIYRCPHCDGWHLTSKRRPAYWTVTDTNVYPTLKEKATP